VHITCLESRLALRYTYTHTHIESPAKQHQRTSNPSQHQYQSQHLNALHVFHPKKMKARAVICVGTGDSEKVFHVESAVLCRASAYIRVHLEHLPDSSQLKEVIELPDEDPTIVEMFIDWAKRPKNPIIYAPGQYSEEPWITNAAAAWILGDRLDALKFKKYALSQFIQNCALAPRGPWKLIEENAPAKSPLLRFSNHWVAWNSSLSGPGVNEYTGLNAARLADLVKPSSRDPRIFDLIHWYLLCGNNINAQCTHDPILRANEQERRRLRRRPPPPEWGAEFEGVKPEANRSLRSTK